jgi:hypothetical protein
MPRAGERKEKLQTGHSRPAANPFAQPPTATSEGARGASASKEVKSGLIRFPISARVQVGRLKPQKQASRGQGLRLASHSGDTAWCLDKVYLHHSPNTLSLCAPHPRFGTSLQFSRAATPSYLAGPQWHLLAYLDPAMLWLPREAQPFITGTAPKPPPPVAKVTVVAACCQQHLCVGGGVLGMDGTQVTCCILTQTSYPVCCRRLL